MMVIPIIMNYTWLMILPTQKDGFSLLLKCINDFPVFFIKPAILLAFILYTQASFAQCLSSFDRVLPDTTIATFQNYGFSVAIHGNYLAVGAFSDDSLAHNGGILYLYEREETIIRRIAVIHPHDLQKNSRFGYSVDLSENTLVVSSRGFNYPNEQDRIEPKIYIYEKPASGWAGQLNTSIISAPAYSRNFGETIKISNDEQNIYASNPMGEQGSVYSFRKPLSGWGKDVPYQEVKASATYLTESLTTDFGEEIEVWGDYLIVGGDMTYHNEKSGGIHVFKNEGENRLNYSPIALLQGKNKGSSFYSGISLAMDAYYIYSSVYDNNKRFFVAYPKNTEWQDEYSSFLLPYTSDTMAVHARSIEVIGDEIFVMAKGAGGTENLFIFDRDSIKNSSYVPERKILKEGVGDSGFASDTDSDGSVFVVGNNWDSELNYSRGSVQLYERALDSIELVAEITESSYNATDHSFGQQLLLFQEHLLVGAPENSALGNRHGAVHIYQKQNNRFLKTASVVPERNGSYDDSFGFDIAGDTNYVVVGAPAYKSRGSVFIYRNTTTNGLSLELDTIILPPDTLRIKLFGAAVAIKDNILAIACMDQTSDARSRLFIYEKNEDGTWQYQDTYSSYGAAVNARGFYSIDILDGQILIGNSFVLNGIGELLSRDTSDQKWKPIASFSPPKTPSVGFGAAVHLSPDHVYLSYPTMDIGGKNNVGAVYVYSKPSKGWVGPQKGIQIVPPDTVENGQFGTSFQQKENTLIIGAPGSYQAYENNLLTLRKEPGAAYVISAKDYKWQDFTLVEKIKGLTTDAFDGYGFEVTLNEDHFFVGAPWESTNVGFNSGAVYVTNMPPVTKVVPPVCEDASPFNLSAFPIGGEWKGPGVSDPVAGTFDPSLAGVGKHLLTYHLTDCDLESKVTIVVDPKPSVTGTSGKLLLKCKNEPITLSVSAENAQRYKWFYKKDVNDGFTALEGLHSNSIKVNTTGIFFCEVEGISCTVNSGEYKVEEENIHVQMDNPTPQYVCSEEPVQLSVSASTGKEFNWYFSTSLTHPFTELASETTRTLLAKEEGFYFSRIKGESCLFYSDTVEVISAETAVKVEQVPVVCSPEKLFLKASPEGGRWYGEGISDSENGIFDPFGLKNGDYQVEYHFQQNGCTFKSGIIVSVDITAAPGLQYESTEICLPHDPILEVRNSHEFDRLEWYRVENSGAVFIESNQHNYKIPGPGRYFVKGYKNACSFSSDTLQVTVQDITVKVPNVFTPNNDPYNQTFEIKAENLVDFQLKIINRWGKNVYSSQSIEKAWEAEGFPAGVYYWVINYKDCWNENHQLKGYVQVIR